jgi:hypothetical protein
MKHFLLRIEGKNISFGCISASDMSGKPAMIILYENIRCHHVDIVPNMGDVLLCAHIHSRVFIPICRLCLDHFFIRKLPIPLDVAHVYFPLFESLKHTRSVIDSS